MGTVSVKDIKVYHLERIFNKKGDILKGMRNDSLGFTGFEEVYFTHIKYNNVKAWKKHKIMHMNLIVPVGNVLFVFVDESGLLREEKIGESKYCRITVPSGIWFGFKGISITTALVMNFSNLKHADEEVERKNIDEICYDWKLNL